MSGGKVLQNLDKKDLECSICLERFKEPKTLNCIHSYCLPCLQTLLETQGKVRCPKCCQTYECLKKEDLQNLPSNEMISHLVQYVEKIEYEKPANCSSCDNQPLHYCIDCQLYICGECIKQHKIIPVLKGHSLYTLDVTEEQTNDENCQIHCEYLVDFFCQTCNKRGCKKCEHVIVCYKNKHDVIEMKMAVDEFKQNATDVMHTIEEIKDKLRQTFESISNDRSNFESQLKLCKTAIEIKEKQIIKKVQEKTKALLTDLDEIYKEKMQIIDSQVKNIESNQTEVNKVLKSIMEIKNNPEETETLRSYDATVTAVKDKVSGDEFHKLFHNKNITPNFVPFNELDNLLNINGIGTITNASYAYEITKDNESIIVTKGQSFTVKVSSLAENEVHQLAATLVIKSGEESAKEIENQGNGEYRIKGRCNVEGDWKMNITAGAAHIKGSPVNIKVEKIGLVQTIDNISTYKENDKLDKVRDVMLGKDGCIFISSLSKDLLKFNQSGSFVETISFSQGVCINRMYKMNNDHIVYSDYVRKQVVMCDDKFQEICVFGNGTLQYPKGLTINETTRILYIADTEAHCVFKFNVDDGSLLGRIGSKGSEVGKMNKPEDVTLTKDGLVIVAEFGNDRIQMFDTNDKLMKVLVGCGEEDGKIWCPHSVTIDIEENMLISSNKLQLFDKNGKFLKRIDDDGDGLDIPLGSAVISDRPRRVAVANHKANNIKIFNY